MARGAVRCTSCNFTVPYDEIGVVIMEEHLKEHGRMPRTKRTEPPEWEDTEFRFGFFMNTTSEDPDGVELRITENGESKIVADIRFRRADFGDLLAGRRIYGRFRGWRM